MHAVAHPHARPDLYRPGVGAVLVSTWRVGTPSGSGPPSRPSAGPGRAGSGPTRDCSRTASTPERTGTRCCTTRSGRGGVYEDFVRTHRDDRNAEIDAAVPGIERVVLHRYAPPRPAGAPGPDALPGAVPVVPVVPVVSVVESGAGTPWPPAGRDPRPPVRRRHPRARPHRVGGRPARRARRRPVVRARAEPRRGRVTRRGAYGRKRRTCGSWSLSWSANSALMWTLSYAKWRIPGLVRIWSRTWLLPW